MFFFFKKSKAKPSADEKTASAANHGSKSGDGVQISVENATISYEGRPIINDLTFSVCEGDYLAVIGEGGAGKSTLLSVIAGLSSPTKGKVKLKGITRSQIGILPQLSSADLDFSGTVSEVVLAGCLARSAGKVFLSKDSRQIVASTMEKLSITMLSEQPFRTLSGGQKQRVMLARALCAAEKMLILDEPTTGLDSTSTEEIYSLIKELNREGMTVMIVTSDVSSALKYSSKILRVNKDSHIFLDTEDYKKLPEAARYL